MGNLVNLDVLSEAIGEWHKSRFPGKTLEEIALKIGEESGEFQAGVLKRNEVERGERDGDPADWTANIHEELCQLMIVIFAFAWYEGMALDNMLRQVWTETEKRTWKK